jgi:hypothetical protein
MEATANLTRRILVFWRKGVVQVALADPRPNPDRQRRCGKEAAPWCNIRACSYLTASSAFQIAPISRIGVNGEFARTLMEMTA